MGNSSTKEQRSSQSHPDSVASRYSDSVSASASTSPTQSSYLDRNLPGASRAQDGRAGRADFLASIGVAAGDRDLTGTDWRKETKQEREARKLEKERVAREKERERSMREEHVDGGYLVTQGVYTGTEDYSKPIVRQLMIERRLAPFWKGLNDHQDSWTENQLVAAAKGLPIPAPDDIPPEDEKSSNEAAQPGPKQSQANIDNLTVPITSRSQSLNSDASSAPSSSFQAAFAPPAAPPPSMGPPPSKPRSKTLASLTGSSKASQAEMAPREVQLPQNLNVNGQRLEAHLYKDAAECPICFLYYPPFLNKTRCCDQAMCSECFVQIKRPDPHPPEHADPSAPQPSADEAAAMEGELVSEPATCPFCKVPEFGITYDSPPFRRGIAYANHPSSQPVARATSGMSSSSSVSSVQSIGGFQSPFATARRRTMSVSANSPTVITTDQVRPDWADKLATARAHTARRSAAASALHAAAYLMGNRNQEADGRGFAGLRSRGILRRTSGGDNHQPSGGTSSAQLGMLAMMSERNAHRGHFGEGGPSMAPGPRSSSGRGRMDDLEDMMMMEAIRLSLASEEERRKREEKEAKKEAKKKEKAEKKAEKAAKKSGGSYPSSANTSTVTFNESAQSSAKGKSVAPQTEAAPDSDEGQSDYLSPTANPQSHLERARAQIQNEGTPLPSPGLYSPAPYKPSHLRTQSNVSSSASSLEGGSPPGSVEQDPREPGSSMDVSPAGSRVNIPSAGPPQENFMSGTPPAGGAGSEPMFNFRSLAAMVGDDDEDKHKDGESSHIEHAGDATDRSHIYDEGDLHADMQAHDDIRLQMDGGAEATSDTKVSEIKVSNHQTQKHEGTGMPGGGTEVS